MPWPETLAIITTNFDLAYLSHLSGIGFLSYAQISERTDQNSWYVLLPGVLVSTCEKLVNVSSMPDTHT